MPNLISRKIIFPFLAWTIYLIVEPIIHLAAYYCDNHLNSHNEYLRPLMPSEEVANPTELGRFRHIKDRLQDPAFDVWVHAKNDWLKVLSTSLINHISPMGVSFQAPTNPQYPFHFGIDTDFSNFSLMFKQKWCNNFINPLLE